MVNHVVVMFNVVVNMFNNAVAKVTCSVCDATFCATGSVCTFCALCCCGAVAAAATLTGV